MCSDACEVARIYPLIDVGCNRDSLIFSNDIVPGTEHIKIDDFVSGVECNIDPLYVSSACIE